MKLLVDIGPHEEHQVTVTDADNLRDLKVVVPESIKPLLDQLLREHRYGSFDGEHAWLDIEALRAGRPLADTAWHEHFIAMIEYADTKGWVSAETRKVRAHCSEPD